MPPLGVGEVAAAGARWRSRCAGRSRMAGGPGQAGDSPRGLWVPLPLKPPKPAGSAPGGKWDTRGTMDRRDPARPAAQTDGPAAGGRGQAIGELGAVDRHRPGAHVQTATGRVAALAAVATVPTVAAVPTGSAIAAVAPHASRGAVPPFPPLL